MKPKFTTKTGYLTFYALACGYLEVNAGWKDKRVACMALVNAELNLFEVTGYTPEENINQFVRVTGINEARTAFRAALKERGAIREVNRP